MISMNGAVFCCLHFGVEEGACGTEWSQSGWRVESRNRLLALSGAEAVAVDERQWVLQLDEDSLCIEFQRSNVLMEEIESAVRTVMSFVQGYDASTQVVHVVLERVLSVPLKQYHSRDSAGEKSRRQEVLEALRAAMIRSGANVVEPAARSGSGASDDPPLPSGSYLSTVSESGREYINLGSDNGCRLIYHTRIIRPEAGEGLGRIAIGMSAGQDISEIRGAEPFDLEKLCELLRLLDERIGGVLGEDIAIPGT